MIMRTTRAKRYEHRLEELEQQLEENYETIAALEETVEIARNKTAAAVLKLKVK